MIKLRDYQLNAIETIKNTFKNSPRQYVEMPTGSGKTLTFLYYARNNHKRVLVIVPSIQLMNQVFDSALILYEPWQITRKGNRHNDKVCKENSPSIHICVAASIRGEYLEYLSRQPFDLIVIDEAHHAQSNTYRKFLNYVYVYNKENPPFALGVTATPERKDGMLLDQILYQCSFKISIEDLIEQNHLCDIEGFSVKTKIDISNVDSHNGDFSLPTLYKKLCVDSRNELILNLCKNEFINRKTLVFCINIQHSKMINDLLNKQGLSSAHIDGKTEENKKNSILSSFRNGEINFLCNCQLLTEGFDEPSIDGIVLARPTTSRSLFIQMLGRGLRNFPNKKNCKVVDIVDIHKSTCGFNSLLTNEILPQKDSIKSLREIKDHIGKELFKISEFKIERANLLSSIPMYELQITESMMDYLNDNHVEFHHPITFDECSFLIWLNELEKEIYGCNS